MFLSVSFSQRTIEETLLTKISKYLDYVKGFTRNALILAVHLGTKHVAAQGGQTSGQGLPRSWICNADVSPSVNDVRFFLSNETTDELNKYIKNFKIHDLPTINITDFTCVDYDLNDNSVFSGKNDERFNVGSYGSKANVTLENNTVFSNNDVYEEIAQDRFWYIYRKFKEWIPTGASILVGGTCSCLSEICNCPSNPAYTGCELCSDTCPGFQACLEAVIEEAKKALVNTFGDDYIDCTSQLIGCYHELEPCTGIPQCIDWENAPACNSCNREKPGELCVKSVVSQAQRSTSFGYYPASFSRYSPSKNSIYFADVCSDLKCKFWAETRGAMEATFSCTDKKYLLSVSGDRHLTFSVHGMVKLRSMNCLREGSCIESKGKCVCPPGSWCTGCEK